MYDLNNRITDLVYNDVNPSGSSPLVDISYGYDAHGNRLWTLNGLFANRSEVYSYDARHRLTGFARGAISWSGTPGASAASITGGNLLAHAAITGEQSWTLDRRGNWTTFVNKVGNPLVTTTQNRTPNAANEYTTLDPDGPNPPGTQSPGGLNHDAKGNLTLDPYAPNHNGAAAGQKYEYDAENRLIRVRANDGSPGTVLFDISYDAIGRRIASVDHTGSSNPDEQCGGDPQPVATRHVFSGIQTIEEYICCSDDPGGEDCDPSEDWDLAREFIWGPRFPEPVAMVDHTDAGDVPKTGSTGGSGGGGGGGGPEILHYLHDVLGSSIVLTNSDGAAVERYTYDPYGRTVIETYDASLNGGSGGWVVSGAGGAGRSKYGNPFLWTGQRYDAGVLLYHFLFRSYSPSLGRWLSRDPAGYVDGVNLYEAAISAPLSNIDVLGLDAGGSTGGYELSPPVPVPGAPDIGGKWNPDPHNSRGGSWGPARPIRGQSQPSASWDPEGHWDVDDGKGANDMIPEGIR